jgi:formylmethanofuran dehydrogenase subunit D
MARFYFTIKNNQTFEDNTGYLFESSTEAVAYAEVMAQELARLSEHHGSSLLVTNELGKIVKTLAIKASPSLSAR